MTSTSTLIRRRLTAANIRQLRGNLATVNARHGPAMEHQPGARPTWRSRDFLAVRYEESFPGVLCRLSVCRTMIDARGEWLEGITWDQLQRVKRQCGFADHWAVEVFPPEADVVNVSNMRHLWIMAEPLPFGWRDPAVVLEELAESAPAG